MIITFVGHGSVHIDSSLTDKLISVIRENVQGKDKVFFYCGGYGDFDNHCASICRKMKVEIPRCEVVLVTPYITPSRQKTLKYLIDAELYDFIVYPPIEKALPRFAISKRNEWMVNEADLIIAYVSHTYGGAYKTLEYARKKNKRIINIYEILCQLIIGHKS